MMRNRFTEEYIANLCEVYIEEPPERIPYFLGDPKSIADVYRHYLKISVSTLLFEQVGTYFFINFSNHYSTTVF